MNNGRGHPPRGGYRGGPRGGHGRGFNDRPRGDFQRGVLGDKPQHDEIDGGFEQQE